RIMCEEEYEQLKCEREDIIKKLEEYKQLKRTEENITKKIEKYEELKHKKEHAFKQSQFLYAGTHGDGVIKIVFSNFTEGYTNFSIHEEATEEEFELARRALHEVLCKLTSKYMKDMQNI
ncbi:hypothetical protein KGF43_21690, partial [Clostridioides sp. ZZV14-6044]|uniref:hypothetical protein n=2 Tax=Clostridioides TaxID=1870884 RepID=UPI001D0FF2F5|nr:hypothetical protein [Clostridioides sp. ZZV14-6044]